MALMTMFRRRILAFYSEVLGSIKLFFFLSISEKQDCRKKVKRATLVGVIEEDAWTR